MIGFLSIFAPIVSMIVEETDKEAEARVLAEAQAYVASLSDYEFEAWVISMEKMGRFVEIAKIMRIDWLIERMQSCLPEAVGGRVIRRSLDAGDIEFLGSSVLSSNSHILRGYLSLFKTKLDPFTCQITNRFGTLEFSSETIGTLAYFFAVDIDGAIPRDDTRNLCLGSKNHTQAYAFFVDMCPRHDTRHASFTLAYDNYFRRKFPHWYKENGL